MLADGLHRRAPSTFDTRGDAEAWLATIRADVVRGAWRPPQVIEQRALTFETYAEGWLTGRRLEARTRAHYRSLLKAHLLPTFGAVPVRDITPDTVRD